MNLINERFGHSSSEESIRGLKQDITRADYKFSFYEKEYDFDHRNKNKYKELYNLESKEELINELTLGDHQKKYPGVKCTASFLIHSEKTCLLLCEWQGIGDRI